MQPQVAHVLAVEGATGSHACVRNPIAAEAAIVRGPFDVAKILRASAHTQRALAMNADQLLCHGE